MSAYTDYAEDTSGNTLYAKPYTGTTPLVESPWGSDDVAGDELGTTGLYEFELDSDYSYIVFRQAGGSPAATDLVVGRFSANAVVNIAASTTVVES